MQTKFIVDSNFGIGRGRFCKLEIIIMPTDKANVIADYGVFL